MAFCSCLVGGRGLYSFLNPNWHPATTGCDNDTSLSSPCCSQLDLTVMVEGVWYRSRESSLILHVGVVSQTIGAFCLEVL